MRLSRALLFALLPFSCNGELAVGPQASPLVINEVMTDNDAAWVDEAGEVDDWIEIANVSERDVQLSAYQLRDGRGRSYDFPEQTLAAGGLLVVFADDDVEQGPLHAGWKLSAAGVSIELVHEPSGQVVDHVDVPALRMNEAYARLPSGSGAFTTCRFATPELNNGTRCGPAPAPQLNDESWPDYAWQNDWLASRGPLVLSELALKPARFIEIVNISAQDVDVTAYTLRVATTGPGLIWPDAADGVELSWGDARSLAPGERVTVPVTEEEVSALAADPAFEGVVSLFDGAGQTLERVDFMRWPDGASLARVDDHVHRFQFCTRPSPGVANEPCEPLASRDVADRVRHLYTPGDYDALAQGDTNLAMRGVKFIVDMQAGDVVHLLSTRGWALHFTFIRERIDGEAPLDRCDPAQSQLFNQGWYTFSEREYFRSEGRRYLLGTLDSYAGSGLKTVDYTVGDQIVAQQMQHGFFTVMRNIDADRPSSWTMHPTEPRQINELMSIAGQVPVVGSNAPFRNLSYQPLTEGVAYGVLKFVTAADLEEVALGPDVIAVTDSVPNDIPFVAGLITEAFQTPLAHVNVLSQNRGTPNMALHDARNDPRVAPLLDQLVRLNVSSAGFSIEPTSVEEADAYQRSRRPTGPRVAPRLDPSVRTLLDLSGCSLSDLPSIGAKAAQLAELGHVVSNVPACLGPVPIPLTPFAIPVAYYLDHFEHSGARALLEAAEADPAFRADPQQRAKALEDVRQAIVSGPVDPQLLAALEAKISERFGERRLRFRSSSNTEDLPGFNGAGLYESWSAALHDPERPIADALRGVWASLWSTRAYDEREFGNIDQAGVAMGVLVHPAFIGERANVIAITRDVLDPTRSDIHYMNAQEGEASVANPAPGVTTEQLIHHWRWIPDTPEVEYQSQSSLTHGRHVLSLPDAQHISCYIEAIHDHFQTRLDPTLQNRWFAMDIEIKLVGDARSVVVKQARPYAFARAERPADCREF